MSTTTSIAPASMLDIRYGGGVTEADTPAFQAAAAQLDKRLSRFLSVDVDGELTVKERDGADPKTTLELWPMRGTRLVATSSHTDITQAFVEVCEQMLRQLNDALEKREPMKNRQQRDTIRAV